MSSPGNTGAVPPLQPTNRLAFIKLLSRNLPYHVAYHHCEHHGGSKCQHQHINCSDISKFEWLPILNFCKCNEANHHDSNIACLAKTHSALQKLHKLTSLPSWQCGISSCQYQISNRHFTDVHLAKHIIRSNIYLKCVQQSLTQAPTNVLPASHDRCTLTAPDLN